MNESTIIMPCNAGGSYDPTDVEGWSYLDWDWSNWKGTGVSDGWAKHKPMDCEELMVKQVAMVAATSPATKNYVYRNFVKALPWFTSVRTKLTDPAYAAWFVRFNDEIVANHSLAHVPVCDTNYEPPLCSDLYHDQSQTPGYPKGDGNCAAPACDVGTVPVGEYLFDHRNANVSVNNQTLVEWMVEDYFGGPAGLGNDHIIGFYIDDDWGNMNPGTSTTDVLLPDALPLRRNAACSPRSTAFFATSRRPFPSHSPPPTLRSLSTLALRRYAEGPSEMNGHAMVDIGFNTGADLKAMVAAYNWVTNTVYREIVKQGKFAWNLFLNNDPNCINCGDCPHPWVKRETCAADIRAYGVNASSPFIDRALLYGFSPGSCGGTTGRNLTEVDEDIANFLLVRGDYAYLGNGWTG